MEDWKRARNLVHVVYIIVTNPSQKVSRIYMGVFIHPHMYIGSEGVFYPATKQNEAD